jgi:hypothetical protein
MTTRFSTPSARTGLPRPRRQDGSLRTLRSAPGIFDVTANSDDGKDARRAGEWHFGWALEGRAIQDVWIVPAPLASYVTATLPPSFNSYGTHVRVYDPDIDAWRDPVEPIR